MATDFTNKYMQVFQDYNEFSEHSADYVRGEDHIAFLIEENEVIYWLYLEQVWRPLNVRTTTTGQLEDGRTKVAVRLEYVEGGQKYTSVPNIPDPERITSMSHFLEDYPDIEEVNVSGTVNLTDLSYAFAGSKIKDFSMLDTSNVIRFSNIFSNIKDETRDLTLKINQSINNIIASDIILNNLTIESTNNEITSTIKLGESDIKNSLIIKGNINFSLVNYGFYVYNLIESDADINLLNDSISSHETCTDYNKIICKQLTIGWNNINNYNTGYAYETYCDKIIIEDGNNNGYALSDYRKIECYNVKEFELNTLYDNSFGGGIKFNNSDNIKITINDVIYIGNFWFTTPIVDDTFYAKYAQYNTPISIFQYKTTFEEVADVNISSEVDSSLLYVDWSSIDFDLSNTSIELYNCVNINTKYYSGNIKKLIIDNSNVDGINKENCPYLHDFYSNRFKVTEGYVSGIFKSYNSYNENESRISENKLLKNITLIDFIYMKIDNGDFLKNNNIKFDYVNRNKYIKLNIGGNKLTELDTLINDNNININLSCNYTGDDSYPRRIKNIDGVIFNIGNSIEDSNTNIYIIIDLLFEGNNNNINSTITIASGSPNDEQVKESIYINGNSKLKTFYHNIYGYDRYNYIKNIYGKNLTISIDDYITNMNEDWNLSPYKHIDINNVTTSTYSNEFHILYFINCDDETNINTITRLVDNTDSSSKTIYMYRSQANIIGEENIAGAVAKNYEIAIIEN